MRTIYLVRHGQTEESLGKGRCICRTDIPLSGEGRRQAQALGDWLGAELKNKQEAVQIFTSPCPGAGRQRRLWRRESKT